MIILKLMKVSLLVKKVCKSDKSLKGGLWDSVSNGEQMSHTSSRKS